MDSATYADFLVFVFISDILNVDVLAGEAELGVALRPVDGEISKEVRRRVVRVLLGLRLLGSSLLGLIGSESLGLLLLLGSLVSSLCRFLGLLLFLSLLSLGDLLWGQLGGLCLGLSGTRLLVLLGNLLLCKVLCVLFSHCLCGK